ncbi:MAG: ABC transporter ATP-binding protein [Acidobacteriota bacterium]|nr:ABC transporter ATP-binding protein [Acidobacteriota bacterium]
MDTGQATPGHHPASGAGGCAQGGDRAPVIEVEGVTKTYPGEPPVQALRGVNLTIGEGELVGIVGPSGSGKTTLLQVMGTLDRPTRGRVRITGQDVAAMLDDDLSHLRATRIGFVFQQFFLAEHDRVIDNVADGLLYAGVPLDQRRRRALDALELVGLSERAQARPTQLSGGQRQRVAIARAVIGRPAIVFADEPTGNLDQTTGQSILALIEQLHHGGSTIVVITHDRVIADRMPRRVEILDGQIVADTGPPAPADRHPCPSDASSRPSDCSSRPSDASSRPSDCSSRPYGDGNQRGPLADQDRP